MRPGPRVRLTQKHAPSGNVIRCRPIFWLIADFVLLLMPGSFAAGAVPPALIRQQQDRAVGAYCAEWRETGGKLDADQMNKRVISDLEKRYPAAFPECRPKDRGTCAGWLSALVEGLRRYGGRSLRSLCASFREQRRLLPQPWAANDGSF
jgi:hypothetical protein